MRSAQAVVLKPWRRFRAAPLLIQLLSWVAFAIVFAIVGLALEEDPVNQPEVRAVLKETRAGPAREVGPGHLPAGTGKEGADPQLGAGETPAEVGTAPVAGRFQATTQGLTGLFQRTLGRRGRGGLNKNELVSASCTGGRCRIEYVPDGPGLGRLIEAQGPIWTTLPKDPRWKAATILALPGGPDVAGKGGAKRKGPPAVSISCTREDVAKVGAWGIQSAPRIKQLCAVTGRESPGH